MAVLMILGTDSLGQILLDDFSISGESKYT